MRIVAILAGGGGFVAGLHRHTVNTGAVTGGLLRMASRAVDGLNGTVVIRVRRGDVGVATGAGG